MGQIFHNAVSQDSIGFGQRIGIGSSWSAITGLVALLALTGTAAAAAELTPTESVKSTITEVVRILNNAELNQPGRSAERRQQVERVVRDRVSYEEMAKRALGAPWMDLADSERQEFVGLFVQLLRDTFAGRIDEYTGEQVLYLSEQLEERCAEVKTKLLTDAKRAGAQTLGGLAMLVYQGAMAFELWTGKEAPIDVMFEAAKKAL